MRRDSSLTSSSVADASSSRVSSRVREASARGIRAHGSQIRVHHHLMHKAMFDKENFSICWQSYPDRDAPTRRAVAERLVPRLRLARVLDGARLPNRRDLDLARVIHRLLDALGDVVGQALDARFVNLVRPNQYAQFATGLNRVARIHAVE